jgi:hypothetical protein
MIHMRAFALGVLAVLGFSQLSLAHEVTMRAEERVVPYTGDLPNCDNDKVLESIEHRFKQREKEFWHSDLTITRFDRIGRTANRPWGADFIPRKFCHGRVHLSNGKRYGLVYSIIEDGGMPGWHLQQQWGVQWCVVGLDRNMHFAPQCRAARP